MTFVPRNLEPWEEEKPSSVKTLVLMLVTILCILVLVAFVAPVVTAAWKPLDPVEYEVAKLKSAAGWFRFDLMTSPVGDHPVNLYEWTRDDENNGFWKPVAISAEASRGIYTALKGKITEASTRITVSEREIDASCVDCE